MIHLVIKDNIDLPITFPLIWHLAAETIDPNKLVHPPGQEVLKWWRKLLLS